MSLVSGSAVSYLTTAQALIPHWQNANTLSTARPIVLSGGYTFIDFLQDRDTLGTKIDLVRTCSLQRATAAARRDGSKQSIRDFLTRYRAAVLSQLRDTPYARNLPRLPSLGSDETHYKEPFLRAVEQWKIINSLGATVLGFTAPLVLGDGATLETFVDALSQLEELYREMNIADTALDCGRQERDALLEPFKKRMQQYKAELLYRFGASHPLVQSLPDLSHAPERKSKAPQTPIAAAVAA